MDSVLIKHNRSRACDRERSEDLMKFAFLLYILKRKLVSASKKVEAVRAKIAEKDFSILIGTAAGKPARSYTFSGGGVTSIGGANGKADVSLVWSDADTAFKIMSSGSNKATMKALQEGKLKIEGNAALALQFTAIVQEMMKKKK